MMTAMGFFEDFRPKCVNCQTMQQDINTAKRRTKACRRCGKKFCKKHMDSHLDFCGIKGAVIVTNKVS